MAMVPNPITFDYHYRDAEGNEINTEGWDLDKIRILSAIDKIETERYLEKKNKPKQ